MNVRSWPRLLVASVVSLAIAVAVGLQASSSISTRTAPEIANNLFPLNGNAKQQLAFARFTETVVQSNDIRAAARQAEDLAIIAHKAAPLSPKAHAIIALASADVENSEQLLDVAGSLNRRDIALQAAILERHTASQDYTGTVTVLDQILRVHPERSEEFFPLLIDAMVQYDTVPLFAEMLDGNSPWHERFLLTAVRQPAALEKLAQLRPDVPIDNKTFDQRLIAGLAGQGNVEAAANLYRLITKSEADLSDVAQLDWSSDFAPFDWRFVDEPGFRAQQSPDGESLEISARPGQGGVIAAKLIQLSNTPATVRVDSQISPVDQMRDVRLQLSCAGSRTPFFYERLSRQEDGFVVTSLPDDCEYQILAINARAWSGRSALNGKIRSIQISQ